MIEKIFRELFEQEPLLLRAPVTVNLMGQHLDYNKGLVLSAAIDSYAIVACGRRDDGAVRLFSLQHNELLEIDCTAFKVLEKGHWANYLFSVMNEISKRGYLKGGFNMVTEMDDAMPDQTDMAVALGCAVCCALTRLYDLLLPRLEIIQMVRLAMQKYDGGKYGVMPVYASLFGMDDNLVLLDCKQMKHQCIPVDTGDYSFVLLDSGVLHRDALLKYQARQKECEEGIRLIQRFQPAIKSLRDVNIPMLNNYVDHPVIYQRCQFVILENIRVQSMADMLTQGSLHMMKQLMTASHQGLRHQYEVSCTELDFLVETVNDLPSVLGARMTGAGFGGCTLNVMRTEDIEGIHAYLEEAYREKYGLSLICHVLRISNGLELMDALPVLPF